MENKTKEQKPLWFFVILKKVVKKNLYQLRSWERDIIANYPPEEHPFAKEFNNFCISEATRMFEDENFQGNSRYSWAYGKHWH
jgi:hypothetical protein